jgi:hypothetical protein
MDRDRGFTPNHPSISCPDTSVSTPVRSNDPIEILKFEEDSEGIADISISSDGKVMASQGGSLVDQIGEEIPYEHEFSQYLSTFESPNGGILRFLCM